MPFLPLMLDTDDSVAIMPTSPGYISACLNLPFIFYVENEEPQPHIVFALGFLIMNCAISESFLIVNFCTLRY